LENLLLKNLILEMLIGNFKLNTCQALRKLFFFYSFWVYMRLKINRLINVLRIWSEKRS